MKTNYINRNDNKVIKENAPGFKLMKWLYYTKSGNFFLETVVKRKFLSVIYGKFQDVSISRKKISKFIESYNIDLSLFEKKNIKDYQSFNDFFYRKLDMNRREIDYNPNNLISPADSKGLFFQDIDEDLELNIKGFNFNLELLLGSSMLSKKYIDGSLAIFRLAPSDYHRYHFIDKSIVKSDRITNGYYYSVNPLALNKVVDLYSKNKRDITLIETENFGNLLYIEVGATFVGSIIQTYEKLEKINRGDEKGYFKFGGSTVILLFEKNKVIFDKDLIDNTSRGYETLVSMGEKIGIKYQ